MLLQLSAYSDTMQRSCNVWRR